MSVGGKIVLIFTIALVILIVKEIKNGKEK